MTTKDTGGPAFPAPAGCGQDTGMTLRDYFAAKAMQGKMACPYKTQSGADVYARDSYAIADAMLAERAK